MKKQAAVVVGGVLGSIGSAMAAVPTDTMTAITGASTDAVAVAWAVFGVIVAIFAVKKARSAL